MTEPSPTGDDHCEIPQTACRARERISLSETCFLSIRVAILLAAASRAHHEGDEMASITSLVEAISLMIDYAKRL